MGINERQKSNSLTILLALILVPLLLVGFLFLSSEQMTQKLATFTWFIPTIVTIIMIILVKLVLSFVLWKVEINDKEKYLRFRTLSRNHILKAQDVTEWGVRVVQASNNWGVRLRKYFFECKLNNGTTFIYPLNRKYNTISVKAIFPRIAKILDKKPASYDEYSIFNNSLKRIKYDFWDFLSF